MLLRVLALAALVALALGAAGCGDDDPAAPPPPPPPGTPDALVSSLRQALSEMDLPAYAALLHPGYVFEPLAEDRVRMSLAGNVDRYQELAITERLFGGQMGGSPLLPPLDGVDVVRFDRQGEWEDTQGVGPTRRASFQVELFFRMGDSYIRVTGMEVLEVTAADSVAPGSTGQGWLLSRQVDQTAVAKAEPGDARAFLEDSWGGVKCRYGLPLLPTTPDQLMANFRQAYHELDLEAYDQVLHPAYVFVPLPQDLADLGLVAGQTLPRTLEMAISLRMFSGTPGSTGAPSIHAIDVVLLDPVTEWGPCTDPQLPAAASSLERLYRIEIHFVHSLGYFRVSGPQKFYAVDVPDGDRPHYYLAAQRDFTTVAPKSTQDQSWGGVKGLYR